MARVTAMSSIGYAFYTLYEALPRMAARGFKRVEIGSFGDYCYHFNFGSPSPSELRSMLSDLGLTPIALNWSPAVATTYDRASVDGWLDAFDRKMDHALEVGIPMMTMHFGMKGQGMQVADQRRMAAETYREMAERALSRGMKMLLELPHLYLVHDSCEPVHELLESLDLPNVGLLLDSSHWGVIGYDLEAFVARVGPRLWHIHLRDSTPDATPEQDRKFKRPAIVGRSRYNLTLTPGLGGVDFARLGAALDASGYRGDVTTEFEYFDMPLDEIERQYDAGLAHLRACGWTLPASVRDASDGRSENR